MSTISIYKQIIDIYKGHAFTKCLGEQNSGNASHIHWLCKLEMLLCCIMSEKGINCSTRSKRIGLIQVIIEVMKVSGVTCITLTACLIAHPNRTDRTKADRRKLCFAACSKT